MLNFINFVINNRKFIYLGVVLLLILTCVSLFKRNRALMEDNERLNNNQIALVSDIESYKTESGKNAVRIRELELTSKEFKELCEEQKETIDDLNIKVKRLKNITTTGSVTSAGGKTNLKDTVIVTKIDSVFVKDTLQYFKWEDPWNRIEGSIKGKTVDCRYNGIDTVTIAVSRVPKRFLFFRFGTKYVEVNTVNRNPSSHIVYSKAVSLKK